MTCNAHEEAACIVCDFPAWEAKEAAEFADVLEDLRRFHEVELPALLDEQARFYEVELPAMLESGGLTQ